VFRLGIVVWLLTTPAIAGLPGSSWSFQTWQLREGLPNNFVVGTARTRDDYLWIATRTKLARFDGVRFEEIPAETFLHFPAPGARAMCESRDGGLWLALDSGIVLRLGFGGSRAFTNAKSIVCTTGNGHDSKPTTNRCEEVLVPSRGMFATKSGAQEAERSAGLTIISKSCCH